MRRDRMSARMVAAKLFAALGALCLVASFALASLMRPRVTLADMLTMMGHDVLTAWNQAQRSGAAAWMWQHAVLPLMVRPAWLLPTSLGLVFVGAAATFAWGMEPARR